MRRGRSGGGGDPSWGLSVKPPPCPLPGLSRVTPRSRSYPALLGGCRQPLAQAGQGECFLGGSPRGSF